MSTLRSDRRPPRRRWLRRGAFGLVVVLAAMLTAAAVSVLGWWPNRTAAAGEAEAFRGVWYGCTRLPATADGGGAMHWVRVDLTAPGVGLFVTPTDPTLAGTGCQYRLRRPAEVCATERLAVVVNGSLFAKEPRWVPGYWSGQRANGVETAVSDGRVSHVWEHTYLLAFDADNVPTVSRTKPPSADLLARTRWGIGGQGVGLADGKLTAAGGEGGRTVSHTAVGIDPVRRLLFLAVFESSTPRRALQELAALGATDGMLLDSGGSTGMVIGEGAAGVVPGRVLGGQRPVATHFGVRADPLPR